MGCGPIAAAVSIKAAPTRTAQTHKKINSGPMPLSRAKPAIGLATTYAKGNIACARLNSRPTPLRSISDTRKFKATSDAPEAAPASKNATVKLIRSVDWLSARAATAKSKREASNTRRINLIGSLLRKIMAGSAPAVITTRSSPKPPASNPLRFMIAGVAAANAPQKTPVAL